MTPTPSLNTAHILFASPPAWGHLRPLVGFACHLVRHRPNSIVVTIPVGGEYKPLADKEISRYFPSEKDKLIKENIHVISLGGTGKSIFDLVSVVIGGFGPFYSSLDSLAPIKCATGSIHIFSRPPDVVVADFFMLDGVRAIREISQRKVPILLWNSAAFGPVMRIIGPEALGGMGDIEAKAKALAAETGKSYEQAEYEIFLPNAGEVVYVPGMPPMYDYEFHPHEDDPKILEMQIPLHKKAFIMLNECDGIVSASSAAFEPEMAKAVRAWLAETNRPLYIIGPLLPDGILNSDSDEQEKKRAELVTSTNGQEVITFLDKVHANSGPHSLLYVSFGSFFWPPGEGIWKVIEYILDMNIPLLLAYDEPRIGKIPEHIAERFKASERALTSIWTPQQTILSHPVTGWFMTHCGHNSMMEAAVQGVPMIAWPMNAEQPGNAAYMSLTLNIAYEIVEGRSGVGLKPMYRGVQPKGTVEALLEEIKDILKKAFGEDGKQKRENIQVLKHKIRADLREGGDSYLDLSRFVEKYLNV